MWWHVDKNVNARLWPAGKNKENTRASYEKYEEMCRFFAKQKWRDDYAMRVKCRMASMREAADEDDDDAEELSMTPKDWMEFNMEFLNSAKNPSARAVRVGPSDTVYKVATVRQVFLDISGSMSAPHKRSSTRTQRGHEIFRDVFAGFAEDEVPTLVHLIGTKTGSECSKRIVADSDDVSGKLDDIMGQWTNKAGSTYLWEYANTEVLKHKNVPVQEIIIITDGSDNASPAPFKGTQGFQALTRQWDPREKKLQDVGEHSEDTTIRFNLFLLGDCVDKELLASYHDLCQATGGKFHHEGKGTDETLAEHWIVPLLLPQGERDHMAMEHKREYLERLTNGEALEIQGFLALTNGEEQKFPRRSELQEFPRRSQAMPDLFSGPMSYGPGLLTARERHQPQVSVGGSLSKAMSAGSGLLTARERRWKGGA